MPDPTGAYESMVRAAHVALAGDDITMFTPIHVRAKKAVDAALSTLPSAIDAAHLSHQREWSEATFGPGLRTKGVLDHIRKELKEIEDDPSDLREWVDVVILALDGAWRAGWQPQEIIDAIKAKQARNEARAWPDWRTMSADQAIEHDRSQDCTCGRSPGLTPGGAPKSHAAPPSLSERAARRTEPSLRVHSRPAPSPVPRPIPIERHTDDRNQR